MTSQLYLRQLHHKHAEPKSAGLINGWCILFALTLVCELQII